MRFTRRFKTWMALLAIAVMAAGAWSAHDYHRHRIIVTMPDGTPAPNPLVKLDYDPVSYDYHPTSLQGGADGVVHIPRSRANGRGWEIMWIHSNHGGKRYGASRSPSECAYPMTVTLQELLPLPEPPPSSTFEQVMDLIDIVRQIAR